MTSAILKGALLTLLVTFLLPVDLLADHHTPGDFRNKPNAEDNAPLASNRAAPKTSEEAAGPVVADVQYPPNQGIQEESLKEVQEQDQNTGR